MRIEEFFELEDPFIHCIVIEKGVEVVFFDDFSDFFAYDIAVGVCGADENEVKLFFLTGFLRIIIRNKEEREEMEV